MGILGGCGNEKCGVSSREEYEVSNKLGGMTFGRGRLTDNGYWEYPCAACARAFELLWPDASPCWPFEGQDTALLTAGLALVFAEADAVHLAHLDWQEEDNEY